MPHQTPPKMAGDTAPSVNGKDGKNKENSKPADVAEKNGTAEEKTNEKTEEKPEEEEEETIDRFPPEQEAVRPASRCPLPIHS